MEPKIMIAAGQALALLKISLQTRISYKFALPH